MSTTNPMKNIINWFKLRKIQRQEESDLVSVIIKSMLEEPEKWRYTGCSMVKGNLSIWVANSPYADMTINERRLPRRGELRKALAICLMRKMIG